MKVAVLVEQFPELSQTFVVSEIEGLRRAGVHVQVQARQPARRPNPEVAEAARFMSDDPRASKLRALLWLAATRPAAVARDLLGRRAWARQERPTPLRALAPLARRLHRDGVQHLHVHFASEIALDALRLSRLLGLPWSLTAHAYDIYERPLNLPEKLRAATFTTSGCDYTVRDLRALAPGAAVHRIVMGVDAETFRRTRPYPGGRRIVAVGRLVEKKGFMHLIDALAGVPDAELAIVGDGPLRESLEAQAAARGVDERVRWLGALAPSGVRAELEAADVLAMPCVIAATGDRDSMPVVVKEALALEIPVVASDEVGLPEIVREQWGRLVPPGDAEALAGALGELLALPAEDRIRMGRAGRAFVLSECSIEAEALKLRRLMEA